MAQNVILALKGVKKHFGGLKAVDGVDMDVPQGELRAIIGPNGAGKTTLFNLVTGHLPLDAGRILFRGEDLKGLSPHAVCCKGLGRTFQVTSVFAGLTVFENVQTAWLSRRGKTLNLFSWAGGLARDSVMGILESVGLQDQAGKTAGVLAHGDQKRLEMAIALAGDPAVLFLDEPTAGMSLREKRDIMALVQRIARERQLTVVFTEHDMDVVFAIAQRITVMHQGKVIAEGEPHEVRGDSEVRRVYLGQQG